MKRILSILLYFILFHSCNMEDFDLNKLTTPDIKPKVYIPLAYGTYNVKDYLPVVNLGADDAVINLPEIELVPLTWRKGNFSFQKSALDSTSMEVTITNGSPMKAQFEFFFTDFATGLPNGRTYSGIVNPASLSNSGDIYQDNIIHPGNTLTIQPAGSKFVFLLNSNDLDDIITSDGLKCVVTLLQPGTPVRVKSVKDSEFKIQINFCSRINLTNIQ